MSLAAWLLGCALLGQPCTPPGDTGSARGCCHGLYCPATGRLARACVPVHPAGGVCPGWDGS